ncbi:hypothetical protein [Methanobrevibacter sp.]|uniref:hypothetical protein n=1 Tax=Methanobrevibacter sp. TaxID=66852 RepID=UPI003869FFD0
MTKQRFITHWENNQWIFDTETGKTYSSIDAKKLIQLLNDLDDERKYWMQKAKLTKKEEKDVLEYLNGVI